MIFIDKPDDVKREVIRYLVVGILTTVVGLGVYKGCTSSILDAGVALEMQLANLISWMAAVLFAFLMNKNFVFGVKDSFFFQIIKFFLSRAGTLLLDMIVMFVGVTIIGISDILVKLVSQLIVTIANYLFGKFWVFQK